MRGKEIKRLLKERGRSQAELARFLNKTDASVSRLVREEREAKASEVAAIRDFFNQPPEAAPIRSGHAGVIPLYGYAAAGDGERIAMIQEQVLEWLDPPDIQGRANATAAFRVSGESMEPRLFAGELVYVALGLAPARGQDCIVELQDNSALVKTYDGSRDGRIYLKQYNPDKQLAFTWDQMRGLHAVVARA
jgi:phage repressor protein C with HTH and peptisase S24 domain